MTVQVSSTCIIHTAFNVDILYFVTIVKYLVYGEHVNNHSGPGLWYIIVPVSLPGVKKYEQPDITGIEPLYLSDL